MSSLLVLGPWTVFFWVISYKTLEKIFPFYHVRFWMYRSDDDSFRMRSPLVETWFQHSLKQKEQRISKYFFIGMQGFRWCLFRIDFQKLANFPHDHFPSRISSINRGLPYLLEYIKKMLRSFLHSIRRIYKPNGPFPVKRFSEHPATEGFFKSTGFLPTVSLKLTFSSLTGSRNTIINWFWEVTGNPAGVRFPPKEVGIFWPVTPERSEKGYGIFGMGSFPIFVEIFPKGPWKQFRSIKKSKSEMEQHLLLDTVPKRHTTS